MNTNLPETTSFENFYIWFNKEKREEYYSTPLYFYKASFNMDLDNRIRTIYWSEKEKTDNGLKHPSSIYFPYVEKFGLLLLRFLNADLSSYETAYKDFFYAYGFEILKDLDENYKFDLSNNYESDENYLKETKVIFNNLQDQLIEIQQELINAVTYIYNLDEKEDLKPYSASERYAVYLITHKGSLYTYAKNDHIIRDSYSNKNRELTGMSEQNLLESLKNKSMLISMQDTHQSNDLSSICYAILEELSKTTNNPIKKCQNCGMYFIPNSRLDEVYCDYPKGNKKTCREQGAMLSYQNRLKEKSAYGEYRKLYQQKFGIVSKNKNDKKLKKDFENWKKLAKDKITKLKHGELTESEVYEWLEETK